MGLFGHFFGHDRENEAPGLQFAIERAVSGVEPLLKQTNGYPENFRKPVATALEYAHSLAVSIPGPVLVDRESYSKDAFVHVLFPDIDSITEAICSSLALQDYLRDFPTANEVYALMGMRRFEKSMVGMELSGQTIQRDVAQKVVYFTSHTLENPASSEQQVRERAATSFFDSLVNNVKTKVAERKRGMQALQLEKEMLMARLRTANAPDRPALKDELDKTISSMQSTIGSLELSHYTEVFESVLLNPEQHLRLNQTPVILDSMGIERTDGDANQANEFTFIELIGYDRRNWTVTMVRCDNLQSESFANRLEKAYRRLVL